MLTRVVENIQRSAVTEADETEADHRLSLIAVSAAQITKKAKSTTAGDAAPAPGLHYGKSPDAG